MGNNQDKQKFKVEQPAGAFVDPHYHDLEQDMVLVTVDDLNDMNSASIEEFKQFSAGEFLAAGSFWVGVERVFTASPWYEDTLFWFCALGLVAGLVIGYFGYCQLQRRKNRIRKLVEKAELAAQKRREGEQAED